MARLSWACTAGRRRPTAFKPHSAKHFRTLPHTYLEVRLYNFQLFSSQGLALQLLVPAILDALRESSFPTKLNPGHSRPTSLI